MDKTPNSFLTIFCPRLSDYSTILFTSAFSPIQMPFPISPIWHLSIFNYAVYPNAFRKLSIIPSCINCLPSRSSNSSLSLLNAQRRLPTVSRFFAYGQTDGIGRDTHTKSPLLEKSTHRILSYILLFSRLSVMFFSITLGFLHTLCLSTSYISLTIISSFSHIFITNDIIRYYSRRHPYTYTCMHCTHTHSLSLL
jgi:hypothetical protein